MTLILPQPGREWKTSWASQLIAQLQKAFDQVPSAHQTGAIYLWTDEIAVPKGFLECDGSTYSAANFRALASILPESTTGNFDVPDLTGPTGAIYIIRV